MRRMTARETGAKLFVGCFNFEREADEASDDADASGSFQIVVEAASCDEALARCKNRLDEIAADSVDPEFPGPSRIFLSALIEFTPSDLQKGAVINWCEQKGETDLENVLPEQGAHATARYPDDFAELVEPLPDLPLEEGYTALPVWDGISRFESKWKLYWCTTPDHDEDWFVIARETIEAETYHTDAEGYDEDDATAELVCVLPASEQNISEPGWPNEHQLRACGAEYLPNIPQDNNNALRHQVGSGSRVVRLCGRIYAEGDIVGNVTRKLGANNDS
jgi:hypothetical protein